MTRIDLNCDLGELPEAIADGTQEALLRSITSANVACGGHAGNAQMMRATIEQAVRAGVAVGAHPGYPDRANFGRLELNMPLDALAASVCDQVLAFAQIAGACGVRLTHVKPHGALYNQAVKNRDLAAAIAKGVAKALALHHTRENPTNCYPEPSQNVTNRHLKPSQNVVIPSGASAIRSASGTGEVEGSASLSSQTGRSTHDVGNATHPILLSRKTDNGTLITEYDKRIVLVGLAGSPMLDVFRQAGFPVAAEAFADRRYEPDGTLLARKFDDALIRDPDEAARQALSIAHRGMVTARDGTEVHLTAQTICIHGDTPGAPQIAAAVARTLRTAGMVLSSLA